MITKIFILYLTGIIVVQACVPKPSVCKWVCDPRRLIPCPDMTVFCPRSSRVGFKSVQQPKDEDEINLHWRNDGGLGIKLSKPFLHGMSKFLTVFSDRRKDKRSN